MGDTKKTPKQNTNLWTQKQQVHFNNDQHKEPRAVQISELQTGRRDEVELY